MSWISEARTQLQAAAVEKKLAPALLRLALNDALTFDASTKTGGPNGSIRVERELQHPGNEGLDSIIAVIDGVKKTLDPSITYADLIQLAGIVGVEAMQGPKIAFTPGRTDSRVSPPRGRLSSDPTKGNFKTLMARTGLEARLYVALAGAHPMGMHWGNPLKFEKQWDPRNKTTNMDNTFFKALVMPGGPSVNADPVLTSDPELKTWVEAYARDENTWRAAFAEAFAVAGSLGTPLEQGLSGARHGGSASRASARGGGGAGSSVVQASYGQLVTGAVVVGAMGAVLGYWWGTRRRRRVFM